MSPSSPDAATAAVAKTAGYRAHLAELKSMHQKLRERLQEQWEVNFPTVEETAKEKDEPGKGPKMPVDVGGVDYRTWTSSNGEHQVQAKFFGITEDGQKVKLKRQSDGKMAEVPVARLSKADQRYLGRVAADDANSSSGRVDGK
jgi:hypothetical protein